MAIILALALAFSATLGGVLSTRKKMDFYPVMRTDGLVKIRLMEKRHYEER